MRSAGSAFHPLLGPADSSSDHVQRYPTTLVLGALAGHAAGSLFSLAVVTYHAVIRTANDILVDAKQKKAGPAAKTTIAKGKLKSR